MILSQQVRGKNPPKKDRTTIKTQIHPESQHKWHKKGIPRAAIQEIKETSPLNLTGFLPKKIIPQAQRVITDQFKKQRLTRRVSQTIGRQRNKLQMKGKEETSERLLNEIEASQPSDTEFKAMVIRKLNELTENY